MGCAGSAQRVLPEPPAGSEYDTFLALLEESLGVDNPHGWKIKKGWPAEYDVKCNFKMRIALRPHESGNPNMLLRADGKYKGAAPQDFSDFLFAVENLPGFKESYDVEQLPDGCVKYLRVKAPGFKARDHCWRYTVDKRDDGSIFSCIRSVEHTACPPKPGAIRAYYYNASLFRWSTEEEGVMEMTEFVFQDLKGSLPPGMMNAALPAGTLKANELEMKHFQARAAGG